LVGCPDGCANPIRVQPGPTDPRPTFTAPQTPGVYTFQLVVGDDRGGYSNPDTVVIRVGGLAPPPPSGAGAQLPTNSTTSMQPIANAGPDQSVEPGSTVTLDGTQSSDPDGGAITSYSWGLVGCPDGCANPIRVQPGPTDPRPTFTAPQTPGEYTFELVVVDDEGVSSAPDTVVITVGVEPPSPSVPEEPPTPEQPLPSQPPDTNGGTNEFGTRRR
jgi:PKD repeat protein